jgi:hypothetical protein
MFNRTPSFAPDSDTAILLKTVDALDLIDAAHHTVTNRIRLAFGVPAELLRIVPVFDEGASAIESLIINENEPCDGGFCESNEETNITHQLTFFCENRTLALFYVMKGSKSNLNIVYLKSIV